MALHNVIYYVITLLAVLVFARGVVLQLRMERAAKTEMFDALDALYGDWNRIRVSTPVEPVADAVADPRSDKSQ